MILEIATAKVFAAALKKPLEDLYDSARGATKEKLKKFLSSSAIETLHNRIEQIGTIRTITSRQPISIRSIYYPAKINANKTKWSLTLSKT